MLAALSLVLCACGKDKYETADILIFTQQGCSHCEKAVDFINNRLLVEVEGNYIIDNKQAVSNNVSNFMGEAHVTWLIDKSGNLRLKAFTQTIDRFDENQGLQETGIGISYKEDFNNFKDLKQRIRDRFTNKKRQKKRQARREAQARRAAEEAQRQELLLPEDPPEPEYDLERD